jgi:DNA-3-methyladenine glycosylase II
MSPPSFGAAARILAERDPVIARLVAEAGPPRLSRPTESHFGTLVRAIVYQQLAGRAAAAIHGRLIAAAGGDVSPQTLIALSDEQLRAVGLSRNKMASLRDLAAKVLDGTVVLSPRGLARASDDEIAARLSAVRGIGPWTAEMFLIFQLRRLDVWPVGDLGVRRGYGLAWQVPTPTARELKPLGEPFRPYRSVAAWYCWRAAELYADAAESALTRLGRSFGGHDGGMQKFSLEATARELLERARGGSGGRAATTVIGGHEKVLRQTVIAMVNGATLAEHENSGEASVHVLAGRVRLTAGQHSWEGRRGDLLMVPAASHSLAALEDSAVLLTVAKLV